MTTSYLPEMGWTHLDAVRAYLDDTKFSRYQYARLYPDGMRLDTMFVKVPVVCGYDRAHLVQQMEVELWLDGMRGGGEASIDYDRHAYMVTSSPFDGLALEFAYTVVVADQREEGHHIYPPNYKVSALAQLPTVWRGNVLVFKHGKSSKHPIISMQREDVALVDLIVRRVLREGLFRGVSKDSCADFSAILASRVRIYTRPFFHTKEDWQVFFRQMRNRKSWIVGSVALAVLCMPSRPATPDNLNAIAPRVWYTYWLRLMTGSLGFQVDSDTLCEGEYSGVAWRLVVFTHPTVDNKKITITFARGRGIYELFVNGGNSNQVHAITAREVVCTNVRLTAAGKAVKGWRQQWNEQVAMWITHVLAPDFKESVIGLGMGLTDREGYIQTRNSTRKISQREHSAERTLSDCSLADVSGVDSDPALAELPVQDSSSGPAKKRQKIAIGVATTSRAEGVKMITPARRARSERLSRRDKISGSAPSS
ncbi:hypothetical protein C8R43DRAFT_961790 [Mycena crocata]|nr:hypothetical protein C8R43DRAFT_961790 [Mycena crocata]